MGRMFGTKYSSKSRSDNSLERDFLDAHPNKPFRRELTQGEREHRWTQEAYDEKQAFKREELEWELRNERD